MTVTNAEPASKEEGRWFARKIARQFAIHNRDLKKKNLHKGGTLNLLASQNNNSKLICTGGAC